MCKATLEHEDDALYVIELRQNSKWVKLESIFTSYWRAQEVCDNHGWSDKDYRIKRYKKKYKKKRFLYKFIKK